VSRSPRRPLLLLLAVLTTLSAGAAGRELAPRVLAPTTYRTGNPYTAFAGERFLTVWREDMGTLGFPLMGAFSDASGRRLSPKSFPLAVPPISIVYSMQLLGIGDQYVLFWHEETRGQMAYIDLEGRVTARYDLPVRPNTGATYAWNGTHFIAVTRRSASHIGEATIFDREGRLVRADISIPNYTYAFDAVSIGSDFITFTSGADGLFAQTISDRGLLRQQTIERPQGTPVAGYWTGWVAAKVVDDGDVLVVWSSATPEQAALKSAFLRRDGTLTEAKVIDVGERTPAPLEILRTGDGFVVAFTVVDATAVQPRPWALRLDATGGRAGEPVPLTGEVSYSDSAAASGSAILVATRTLDPAPRIRSVAAGPDAQPRHAGMLSIGYSRQTQPILAAAGGNVLAAWNELAGDDASVRAAVVDPSGTPTAVVEVAPGLLNAHDVSWNGAHFLVVHHQARTLLATRISADGRVVDEQPIVLAELRGSGPEAGASVVWTGEQWLVVWRDYGRLNAARVSRGGIPSARRSLPVHEPLPDSSWERYVQQPVLGFNGQHVLLLWVETVVEPCHGPLCLGDSVRRAIRLTPSGDVAGHALELGKVTEPGPVSIASSGDEFFVLIGPKATIIRSDGNALRVAAQRDLIDANTAARVVWDGRHYVVAMRYRAMEWYAAVRRYDAALSLMAPPRGTRTLGADALAAPSPAAPFAGDVLVGVQEGTVAEGVRATVYREADMTILPTPPAPPRFVRNRQLTVISYEVTWEASPSADVEAYIVESDFGTGYWVAVARVSADTRSAIVDRPSVRVRAVNAGGVSEPEEESNPRKRRSVR